MENDIKKPRPKWVHWTARIGTTFGIAGGTWLYLSWAGLLGGVFFLGLLCALTSMEFSRIAHPRLNVVRKWMLVVISFFTPFVMHRMLQSPDFPDLSKRIFELFLLLTISIQLGSIVFPSVMRTVCRSLLFPIWGITLPLTALIFLAHFFIGLGYSQMGALLWVISIIFITKATDIGALLTGSLIGRHKLAPKTSPGKTIEGAVGGILLSIVLGLILVWISGVQLTGDAPLVGKIAKIVVCAGVISIAGILGDLFESCWKRQNQMKNSGECLPGLGGIYDLTDSIILSAAVSYFLVKYFLMG